MEENIKELRITNYLISELFLILTSSMILLVGLGNPGKKYQNTRHNVGFRIVDNFAKENNFPEFRLSKKFKALISEDTLHNKKILLAKPQTFMNDSGKSVRAIFNFQFSIFNEFSILQFSNKNLIIIHDDIDLPLGKIKITKNRGSAGHKGVQSIINELGTKNFLRFRIGIKPPKQSLALFRDATGQAKQTDATVYRSEDFVLRKFTKEEEKILKEIIKKTCQAIEMATKQGIEKAMAEYNKS